MSDRWRPPGSEGRAPAPRVAAAPSRVATPEREPLLTATDVVRTYRGPNGVQAVRGASLSLAPKDFVALMGPSGSGKTTFLGLMSGLDAPDKGEVRWKGRLIRELSFEEQIELRRTGMGIVFQSFGLLPTLSAIENVELPLRVSGVELRDSRARAEMWLVRLGLGDRLYNRTFELSAGQQQRVAVARALIAEPEVVLADEPIAEVDTENADLILEALWEVIRRGGAVLAATHNPEALRYSSRVVLFRDGLVEAEGKPEEVAPRLTVD